MDILAYIAVASIILVFIAAFKILYCNHYSDNTTYIEPIDLTGDYISTKFMKPHKGFKASPESSNDSLIDSLFSTALTAFASKMGMSVASLIWDYYFTDKDTPTPINEQLTKIIDSMNTIESKIDNMYPMIKKAELSSWISNRNQDYSKYQGSIDNVVRNIIAIGQYKDDEIKSEKEYSYLKEWYQSNHDNFDSIIRFLQNGDYLKKYDDWAYSTFPFEQMGYEFRKQLRVQDATLLSETLALYLRYLRFPGHTDETNENIAKLLESTSEKYLKWLSDNPIIEDNDCWTSQIEGASKGKKYKKYLTSFMYDYPSNWDTWYKPLEGRFPEVIDITGKERYFLQDVCKGGVLLNYNYAKIDELCSIVQYYKNNYNSNVKLCDILKSLKIDIPDNKKALLVGNNGLQFVSNSIFYTDKIYCYGIPIYENKVSNDKIQVYDEWNFFGTENGKLRMKNKIHKDENHMYWRAFKIWEIK